LEFVNAIASILGTLIVFAAMMAVVNQVRRTAEAVIEQQQQNNSSLPASSNAPLALTTVSTPTLREYPVEIEAAHFNSAVHDFLRQHPYRLRPSAPEVLNRHWWEVADEDLATREIFLLLRYDEYVSNEHDEVPFFLRIRLQLLQPGPTRYLQVGWSYEHKYTRRFESERAGFIPSKYARQIVDYTIDELRLELLAVARARNPHLGESLQDHLLGTTKPSGSIAIGGKRKFIDPIVEKAFWPSPQDYNEAMQNPQGNFSLPRLKKGKPELTPLGLPRACSGAFASVYKLDCEERAYAIKCFLTLVHDSKDRYEMISKSILDDDLDYTIDFEFIPDGILIRGKWYPILRMDWVIGEPLNQYVERHLSDPPALRRLADNFVQMMSSIRKNGIAHGDLQHGNILVTAEGIRLVDYDGMFVPGMEGMISNEIGHRNYQHPKRDPTHFGPWLDNFSAWVIYISLRVLASDPQLWQVGAAGDEAILFRQADFNDPANSPLIAALAAHPDPWVKRATDAVMLTLKATPDQVPYLDPN
jgi:hypothetical protein